jgi:hypothetical protein
MDGTHSLRAIYHARTFQAECRISTGGWSALTVLLYPVTDQRNAVAQVPEVLRLSSQSTSDLFVDIADIERIPDVAGGKPRSFTRAEG